jgi:nucleoporin p58/p45
VIIADVESINSGSTPTSSAGQSTSLINQAKPSSGLFGTPASTAPGSNLFGGSTTSQAPTSNLFGGSTPSQPPTSNLFSSATSQPQTSSLFGASKPAQTPGSLFSNPSAPASQSTSLFGNTTTTSQPHSTSLFGAPATSQHQGTSLFGAPATSQPQGTSLFGAPATSQPQGTSLFGAPATSQPQGTSLFGAPAISHPQGTSLFGSSTTKPQQSSLFGGSSSIAQAQPPTSNLFVPTITQPSSQPFAQSQAPQVQPQQVPGRSLLFGSSTAPQPTTNATTIPAVTVDVSNLLPTTRFGDLHPDLQTAIANTQSYIDAQASLCSQIDAFTPGHNEQVTRVPKDVTFLDDRVKTTTTALENDAAEIDTAHRRLRLDKSDAELSFAAVQALHLPAGYSTASAFSSSSLTSRGSQSSKTLLEFFDQRLETLSSTLTNYTSNMTEIEQHLRGVEARMMAEMQKLLMERGRKGGDASSGVEEQIRVLAGVLGDFEAGIMGVAGKVGAAREEVQRLELGR